MKAAETSEILRNQEKPQSCFSNLHPHCWRGVFSTIPRPGKADEQTWFFYVSVDSVKKEKSVLLARKRACPAFLCSHPLSRAGFSSLCPPSLQSLPQQRLPAVSGVRAAALVVAVQAPGPGHLGLAVHPDLPDDALALLQPLGALQLLRRGEHVLVQSPLEAAVSPHREVRRRV